MGCLTIAFVCFLLGAAGPAISITLPLLFGWRSSADRATKFWNRLALSDSQLEAERARVIRLQTEVAELLDKPSAGGPCTKLHCNKFSTDCPAYRDVSRRLNAEIARLKREIASFGQGVDEHKDIAEKYHQLKADVDGADTFLTQQASTIKKLRAENDELRKRLEMPVREGDERIWAF